MSHKRLREREANGSVLEIPIVIVKTTAQHIAFKGHPPLFVPVTWYKLAAREQVIWQ